MNVEWAFLANSAHGTPQVTSALGIGVDTFSSLPVDVLPEQMRLPGQACAPIRFSIVVRFLAKRVECGNAHAFVITISDADGKQVAQLTANVLPQVSPGLPQGWDQPVMAALDFNLVPQSFGHYVIDIAVDGDHKKQIPFRIVEAPRQTAPHA